jgi:hypothetical protein
MSKSIFLVITFYLSCFPILFSQVQYPAKLKWVEIKSSHFKIICPENISEKGQETANLLERVYRPVSASLNKPAKPISLVLNNQSVISNGYAALAPRYMSWYITPFQDATSVLDGSDWFQNLALHEYRHVVQFDKLDTNLIDIAGDIFGDYGKVVASNLAMPLWFFEGDAVYSETINSLGGRGRLPGFFRDNMALEMENKRYSYDKAYLGSYRNHVPNYYHLGYMLTSYFNKNIGEEKWNNVISPTSWLPIPFSFSANMYFEVDHSVDYIYKSALNEYDSLWQSAFQHKRFINSNADTIIASKRNTWTNYTYPFF